MKKFTFLFLIFFLLCSAALFALPEKALDLYREGRYEEGLKELPYEDYQSYAQKELYLLFSLLEKTKKPEQAAPVIERLYSLAVGPVREMIFFERLSFLIRHDRWASFLVVARDVPDHYKSPWIERGIRSALNGELKRYADDKEKQAQLAETLEALVRRYPDFWDDEKILKLLLYSIEKKDPKRKRLLEQLFVRANYRKLDRDLQAELTPYFRKPKSYDHLLEHFKRQIHLGNSTELLDKIPNYLYQLKQRSREHFAELRELYFQALLRSRSYSSALRALESKSNELFFDFEKKDLLSWSFTFHLKKGEDEEATEIIHQLRELGYQEESRQLLYKLADYHYRDKERNLAMSLFDQLDLEELNEEQQVELQWRRLLHYDQTGQRANLIRVALWAREHEFTSEKMASQFCYWSNKLKIFKNDKFIECYEKHPLTYYGLKSKELASPKKTYFPQEILAFTPQERALNPVELYYLDFLELMYLFGQGQFADQLLMDDEEAAKDVGYFHYISKLLKRHERFYALQRLVARNYEELTDKEFYGPDKILPLNYPLAFDSRVNDNAQKAKVNPHLVRAVMREESRFRPYVKSPAGAIGLVQLMPSTAKYMGKKLRIRVRTHNLVEPNLNLRIGSAYMRHLLNRYDENLYKTLAAYNGGPTNVKRWQATVTGLDDDYFVEAITFNETRNYVKRVMKSYYLYQSLYGYPNL